MRTYAWIAVSCSLACAPSVGAGGSEETTASSGDECPIGAVGCECTQGDGCDAGLLCIVGVCIPDDADTSATAPPQDTGAPESSSASETTSAPSTDDTSSDESSSGVTSAEESSSSTGVPLPCGNGRLEDDEVCDDGNTEDGDGCNADCQPGGQELWTHTFDGGLQLDDWGHRVAIDADDDVYVAGLAFDVGNTQRDGIIIKYDDDGQIQWSDRYDSGNGNSSDGFWGVAIAADQSLVIGGWSNDSEENRVRPMVRMYSEDGDPVWTYLEVDAGDAYGYDVVVDSLGDVVITGTAHDLDDGSPQAWMAKLDPTDGEPIWNLRYDVPTGNAGPGLAVDSSDALFVAGANGIAYVRKLDADGGELWTWSDQLDGNSGLYGLAVAPDDDVMVVGNYLQISAYMARHPSDGVDPEWSEGWAGDLGGGALAQGVAFDGAGRRVVVGYVSSGVGNGAVFARKYDVDDDAVWTHEIDDDSGIGMLVGVAIDSEDRVVVSGRMQDDDGNVDVFVRQLTP